MAITDRTSAALETWISLSEASALLDTDVAGLVVDQLAELRETDPAILIQDVEIQLGSVIALAVDSQHQATLRTQPFEYTIPQLSTLWGQLHHSTIVRAFDHLVKNNPPIPGLIDFGRGTHPRRLITSRAAFWALYKLLEERILAGSSVRHAYALDAPTQDAFRQQHELGMLEFNRALRELGINPNHFGFRQGGSHKIHRTIPPSALQKLEGYVKSR